MNTAASAFQINDTVVMFPNVRGTVVALAGAKYVVRDETGTEHTLGALALVRA